MSAGARARRIVSEEAPSGCLGCATKEDRARIVDMLADAGAKAWEVPPPRHAWGDIIPCRNCGRFWLVKKLDPKTVEEIANMRVEVEDV